MTTENQNIKSDFYSGDTKAIAVYIVDEDGVAVDLTNAELSYAIFSDDGKNPQVVLRKTSLDNGIVKSPTTGICIVHLLPADTAILKGTYRHQLHIIDAAGNSAVAMTGRVEILRAFAMRERSANLSCYLAGSAPA